MSVGLNLNIDKDFSTSNSAKNSSSNLDFSYNQIGASSQKNVKLKVATSAILGTVVPILLIAKHQKKVLKLNSWKSIKDTFDIKYGVKEMVAVSGSSIVAGVAAGCLSDTAHKKKHKIKEGIFQFLYAAVPPVFVDIFNKQIEKNKKLNNVPGKIIGIVAGIGAGMFLATAAANRITDPDDKEEDRKVKPKDLLVSLDDALGALVIAKLPIVDKLPISTILPAIFAWCGYRAGKHE